MGKTWLKPGPATNPEYFPAFTYTGKSILVSMKVISVVGYKNSGKTTLISRLVRELAKLGSVGTVKHIREERITSPESDTGKHFDAGATVVMGITDTEMVSVSRAPDLEKALDALADQDLDFAVVEGFKGNNLPKIALGDLKDVPNILLSLPEKPDPDMDALLKMVLSQPEYFTLDSLLKKIRKSPKIKEAGAIGSFTGIVRERTDNKKTSRLEFEKYEPVASESLEKIRRELMQKEGVLEVLIHHKTGSIEAGKDIVYIVAAAAHRTELFEALSEAIERVKAKVPIWKKEFTLEGEFWVHEQEKKG